MHHGSAPLIPNIHNGKKGQVGTAELLIALQKKESMKHGGRVEDAGTRSSTLSFSCISRILLITSRGLMPAHAHMPSASKKLLCRVNMCNPSRQPL